VSEAEDAVQETWLRYESSATKPASVKSFLSAVVTRISIDVLRSARVRREKYVGPWFPEPRRWAGCRSRLRTRPS
jgi:RNA polymerase sigma-70 factor (ECF subfamily)